MLQTRFMAACLLLVAACGTLSGCAHAVSVTQQNGVAASIQSLASGGIAVMDDVRSSTPSVAVSGPLSAMRFTQWQVQNLVNEANAHGGYLGSELDALATAPAGTPPLTTLIDAWLTRKDGALAQYASGLMWQQDQTHPATVVYPTIVVLSFIGDIARVTATSQHPSFDPVRLFAAPAEADGICTDLSGWVSSVVNNVSSAIQSNGTGWLSSLWNTVVSVGGAVVSAAFSAIASSVLGFVTQIATICGVLMQVSSMFKPWSVQLAGAPSSMQLSTAPQDGQFTATLHASDIPWPSTLIDCVKALSNVKLDDASYTDAPVTWTPKANIPGLATETKSDTTLLANKTAAFHFQTTTVEDVPSGGCPRIVPAGNLVVNVSVARSDVTNVLASLESLITNQINAAIRPYLTPYTQAALRDANTAAGKFAAPHQTASIALTEEIADPLCVQTPPPTTPTTQPSSSVGSATMPDAPCQTLLTSQDTTPYLNGGTVIIPTDEHGNQIDVGKVFGSLMSGTLFNAPNGQSLVKMPDMPTAVDYDQKRSTWCVIGKMPATMDALIGELPKGTETYHRSPDMSDTAGIHACRTAIGMDLLNAFAADCRVEGPIVSVFGPNAEYMGMAIPPLSTTSQIEAVMQHVLQRSR